MRPLLILLLLAGCAGQPAPLPPSLSVLVPSELQVCPDGRYPPAPPPPPRTPQQLLDWTVEVHAAWTATERARRECASRLTKLNTWIERELLERDIGGIE